MQTYCVRQGQIEVGIIEQQGHEFSALGATVQGRSVTGYTKLVVGGIDLTTWCGKTMLGTRSEVVERFWSGTLALMFRLPRGRSFNTRSSVVRSDRITDIVPTNWFADVGLSVTRTILPESDAQP